MKTEGIQRKLIWLKQLKFVKLNSAEDVRKKSPSPHGTFNIVYRKEIKLLLYITKGYREVHQ